MSILLSSMIFRRLIRFHWWVIAVLICMFWWVDNSLAKTAINCHCFQDRSYNPDDRFAADDYILASSFNSLLATAFGVPKREIVLLKMKQGVGQNDLLVGLKLAYASQSDPQQLFSFRRENRSWPEIISGLAKTNEITMDPVVRNISSGIPLDRAAAAVADEVIIATYQAAPELISKFRLQGLNEKEIALVFFLAGIKEQNPQILVGRFLEKGESWSEIAAGLGVDPAAPGELILH